jgi:hypothetical protein
MAMMSGAFLADADAALVATADATSAITAIEMKMNLRIASCLRVDVLGAAARSQTAATQQDF